jgi:hypothetical protein
MIVSLNHCFIAEKAFDKNGAKTTIESDDNDGMVYVAQ